jgi:hypothetical protein
MIYSKKKEEIGWEKMEYHVEIAGNRAFGRKYNKYPRHRPFSFASFLLGHQRKEGRKMYGVKRGPGHFDFCAKN